MSLLVLGLAYLRKCASRASTGTIRQTAYPSLFLLRRFDQDGLPLEEITANPMVAAAVREARDEEEGVSSPIPNRNPEEKAE